MAGTVKNRLDYLKKQGDVNRQMQNIENHNVTPEEVAKMTGGSLTPSEGGRYVVQTTNQTRGSNESSTQVYSANNNLPDILAGNATPIFSNINGTNISMKVPQISVGNDGKVNITAPQSFLDSSYYKEQVKPKIESYVGKSFGNQQDVDKFNTEVGTMFSDAVKRWQEQQLYSAQGLDEDTVNRMRQVEDYSKSGNFSSSDDTLNKLKLDVGIYKTKDADGKEIYNWWTDGKASENHPAQQTAKEFLDNFKKLNDEQKSSLINTLNRNYNSWNVASSHTESGTYDDNLLVRSAKDAVQGLWNIVSPLATVATGKVSGGPFGDREVVDRTGLNVNNAKTGADAQMAMQILNDADKSTGDYSGILNAGSGTRFALMATQLANTTNMGVMPAVARLAGGDRSVDDMNEYVQQMSVLGNTERAMAVGGLIGMGQSVLAIRGVNEISNRLLQPVVDSVTSNTALSTSAMKQANVLSELGKTEEANNLINASKAYARQAQATNAGLALIGRAADTSTADIMGLNLAGDAIMNTGENLIQSVASEYGQTGDLSGYSWDQFVQDAVQDIAMRGLGRASTEIKFTKVGREAGRLGEKVHLRWNESRAGQWVNDKLGHEFTDAENSVMRADIADKDWTGKRRAQFDTDVTELNNRGRTYISSELEDMPEYHRLVDRGGVLDQIYSRQRAVSRKDSYTTWRDPDTGKVTKIQNPQGWSTSFTKLNEEVAKLSNYQSGLRHWQNRLADATRNGDSKLYDTASKQIGSMEEGISATQDRIQRTYSPQEISDADALRKYINALDIKIDKEIAVPWGVKGNAQLKFDLDKLGVNKYYDNWVGTQKRKVWDGSNVSSNRTILDASKGVLDGDTYYTRQSIEKEEYMTPLEATQKRINNLGRWKAAQELRTHIAIAGKATGAVVHETTQLERDRYNAMDNRAKQGAKTRDNIINAALRGQQLSVDEAQPTPNTAYGEGIRTDEPLGGRRTRANLFRQDHQDAFVPYENLFVDENIANQMTYAEPTVRGRAEEGVEGLNTARQEIYDSMTDGADKKKFQTIMGGRPDRENNVYLVTKRKLDTENQTLANDEVPLFFKYDDAKAYADAHNIKENFVKDARVPYRDISYDVENKNFIYRRFTAENETQTNRLRMAQEQAFNSIEAVRNEAISSNNDAVLTSTLRPFNAIKSADTDGLNFMRDVATRIPDDKLRVIGQDSNLADAYINLRYGTPTDADWDLLSCNPVIKNYFDAAGVHVIIKSDGTPVYMTDIGRLFNSNITDDMINRYIDTDMNGDGIKQAVNLSMERAVDAIIRDDNVYSALLENAIRDNVSPRTEAFAYLGNNNDAVSAITNRITDRMIIYNYNEPLAKDAVIYAMFGDRRQRRSPFVKPAVETLPTEPTPTQNTPSDATESSVSGLSTQDVRLSTLQISRAENGFDGVRDGIPYRVVGDGVIQDILEPYSDAHGLTYYREHVPVKDLVRLKEFQPRVTASGEGTTKSVLEHGYDEARAEQPVIVRKNGDRYEVLSGHSRTMGLEQRANAGLENPESIVANVYEGISDAEARQISRAANQSAQYESTLDMAKSIAESMDEGLTPQVKINNIKAIDRYATYDDMAYAWHAIGDNDTLREIVSYSDDFSPETLVKTARNARKRDMDVNKFQQVIAQLAQKDKLTKKNVDNVVNLMTGKFKAIQAKSDQTTLFGDDVGTAVNSVDLLDDYEKTSKQLTSERNALKKASKNKNLKEETIKDLEANVEVYDKRLSDIGDEIIKRYESKYTSAEPEEPSVSEGQSDLFDDPDKVVACAVARLQTENNIREDVLTPDMQDTRIKFPADWKPGQRTLTEDDFSEADWNKYQKLLKNKHINELTDNLLPTGREQVRKAVKNDIQGYTHANYTNDTLTADQLWNNRQRREDFNNIKATDDVRRAVNRNARTRTAVFNNQRVTYVDTKDARGTHTYITTDVDGANLVRGAIVKDRSQMNAATRAMNRLVRIYRTASVSLSPMSLTRNIMRDTFSASITSGWNPLDPRYDNPLGIVGTIKSTPSLWAEYVSKYGSVEKADEVLTRLGQNAEKIIKQQAGYTQTSVFNGEDTNVNLIKRTGLFDRVIGFASRASEKWESGMRYNVGEYTLANYLKNGYDYDTALTFARLYANEATTNFNRGVGMFDALNRITPFVSAAINGNRSFRRMFQQDPVGVSMRIYLQLVVPMFNLTVRNETDERRRAKYYNIPEYVREQNMIFIDDDGKTALIWTLPQELAPLANSVRVAVSTYYNHDPEPWYKTMARGALGFAPWDISWLADIDPDDRHSSVQEQFAKGVASTASNVVPMIPQAIYENVSGRSMYTGEQLYGNADSPTLKKISSWLGMRTNNQTDAELNNGRAMNIISSVIGAAGARHVVNLLDTLQGAPEKARGGRSLMDDWSRQFLGTDYQDANTQFNKLVDANEKDRKELVEKRLPEIDSKIRSAEKTSDDKTVQGLKAERQDIIDEYIQNVVNDFQEYADFYSRVGGLSKKQKNRIINLMNLGPRMGGYSFGNTGEETWGGQALSDEETSEWYDAYSRASASGLFDNDEDEVFRDVNGNWKVNRSVATQAALNYGYGVQRQAVYEVQKAIDGKSNQESLYNIRSQYYDRINKIYADARKKGLRSPDKEGYKKIAEIQNEYLSVFDKRMKPVIDKYGSYIVQNSQIADAMDNVLSGMIPSDDYRKTTRTSKSGKRYTTYSPSNEMMTVNTKRWLQKHYGIGYGNKVNVPSDDDVRETIRKINASFEAGKVNQGKAQARRLNRLVQNGSLFANQKDMNTISNALGY